MLVVAPVTYVEIINGQHSDDVRGKHERRFVPIGRGRHVSHERIALGSKAPRAVRKHSVSSGRVIGITDVGIARAVLKRCDGLFTQPA
jgi:hypothetical protein